jgi:hypothetical protein
LGLVLFQINGVFNMSHFFPSTNINERNRKEKMGFGSTSSAGSGGSCLFRGMCKKSAPVKIDDGTHYNPFISPMTHRIISPSTPSPSTPSPQTPSPSTPSPQTPSPQTPLPSYHLKK